MSKPKTINVGRERYRAGVLVRVGVAEDGRPLFRAIREDESVEAHDGQTFVVGYFSDGALVSLFDVGQ